MMTAIEYRVGHWNALYVWLETHGFIQGIGQGAHAGHRLGAIVSPLQPVARHQPCVEFHLSGSSASSTTNAKMITKCLWASPIVPEAALKGPKLYYFFVSIPAA
jgi:hypothetical protein